MVVRLGEHVALRPRAGTESDYNFDLRHEVPVIGVLHATMPASWRRADSSW
jgi:hypothetical protein